ncbi:MAG: hypothetical protein IIC01_00555 [Planctomycetes bacterium]|nr:hypothetical protein [Planctomycetota bacterium]
MAVAAAQCGVNGTGQGLGLELMTRIAGHRLFLAGADAREASKEEEGQYNQ